MDEWNLTTLRGLIITNANSISKNYPYTEIKYLDTGSITCNRISDLPSISLNSAPSRARRLVFNNEIVYSTVRPNLRHYGIIRNPPKNLVVSTGFVTITCDNLKLDPYFFYYYLTQESLTNYLHSIAEGSTSTYPSLKPSDLLALEIVLPPIKEQRVIADILSSIDDKIDLLNRQNETLEAMAQTLFRQWFIEEADDSWEEVELGELVSLPGGFSFKSNTYRQDGTFKVVTIKAIQDGKFATENAEKVHEIPAKLKEHQKLQIGDALISLTGNVGRVCLVDEQKCLLNQRVSKIVGISYPYTIWGYYYFRQPNMIDKLTHLSKGTAQSNLSPVETLRETIRIPKGQRFIDFFNAIVPNHERLIANKVHVRSLNQLRDTLLPKLMSGEARVKLD